MLFLLHLAPSERARDKLIQVHQWDVFPQGLEASIMPKHHTWLLQTQLVNIMYALLSPYTNVYMFKYSSIRPALLNNCGENGT